MVQIIVQLPHPLAAELDAVSGGPEHRSAFVRQLVRHRVGMGRRLRQSARGGSLQIYIRLQPQELVDVDRAAAAAGMARTEWIVALIRRHRRSKPQFARPDRILIAEAHRELHRMSVFLRQIADADPDVGGGSPQLGAELARTAEKIERQMAALREAFEGNFSYWAQS